jgi:protein tyrosine phosphatase (PTP) superfamily phosphohydrolase (DUF442 family)
MHTPLKATLTATILTLAALTACTIHTPPPPPLPQAQTTTTETPRQYPGIHNVVAFHEGFLSGSVPEGDQGFDSLAQLGIKTIISVDGGTPDVPAATTRGIRYIHLPIGYNGFDSQRALELTRATRDAHAQGPVYIHCHHGKHRSAAAAGSAVTALGYMSADDAIARMKVSGTAPNYTGLYACVASTTVIDVATLNAVHADFPSISKPADFVQAMIDLDEMLDHLTQIKNAKWKAPSDHPDLVPAAEAGRLADTLRFLAESSRVKREPHGFGQALLDDAVEAQQLEDAIIANADASSLDAQLKLVAASCKDCHVKYRD